MATLQQAQHAANWTDLSPAQRRLVDALLPHALHKEGDGSHDLSHLQRVWRNVARIRAEEGGDAGILLAATLLHDCVSVEKGSALRPQSSRLAAEKGSELLTALGWGNEDVTAVAHAIESHSFSAGIAPQTLEAKILQDADRLDAIGMVGVARCFYVAGRLGSALYDPIDPSARDRLFDDKRYTIDHFQTKLLKLVEGFQTGAGARLARERHQRLQRFLDEFMDEI